MGSSPVECYLGGERAFGSLDSLGVVLEAVLGERAPSSGRFFFSVSSFGKSTMGLLLFGVMMIKAVLFSGILHRLGVRF